MNAKFRRTSPCLEHEHFLVHRLGSACLMHCIVSLRGPDRVRSYDQMWSNRRFRGAFRRTRESSFIELAMLSWIEHSERLVYKFENRFHQSGLPQKPG